MSTIRIADLYDMSIPFSVSQYNSISFCRNIYFLFLYVVKQKCTTANIVIYSVISFFYFQKFFC